MRTSIEGLCTAFLGLFVLVSCSNEREVSFDGPSEVSGQIESTVHFTTRPFETKASFGEAVSDSEGNVSYPCYWTENDRQVKISLNYEYAVTAGVNTDETDEAGHITRSSFDASFDGIEASNPYSFYLVSPADALLWTSAERDAVSVSVNANQTPGSSSVDEAAMVLVAKSDSYEALPSNVEVDFSHITSYGKLTLTGLDKNVSYPSDAALTTVTLISEEQPIAGSWYYFFSDGNVSEKEGTSSIVLDVSGIDVTGGAAVWFAAAPASLAGKPLTVRAGFSDASYLERTITLKDDFTLTSGKITKFSVNMSSATRGSNIVESSQPGNEVVYKRVTSTSELNAEDEVIFLDSSAGYAMTSTKSGKGLGAVAKSSTSFTIGSDGYIRIPSSSSVYTMKVKSIRNSTCVFYDGGSNYLYYSRNSLSLSSTSSNWTLSFSNRAATMSAGNKSYFQFDGGAFVVGSTSSSFALYKKTIVEAEIKSSFDLTAAPVLEYTDYGAYMGSTNLVYGSTTDQISREYSSDGLLSFSIVAPEEDQAVEISGIKSDAGLGDSFSIGVKFISGITTVIDKTALVFVAKEEGHKLWLADAEGNGFIVKR